MSAELAQLNSELRDATVEARDAISNHIEADAENGYGTVARQ